MQNGTPNSASGFKDQVTITLIIKCTTFQLTFRPNCTIHQHTPRVCVSRFYNFIANLHLLIHLYHQVTHQINNCTIFFSNGQTLIIQCRIESNQTYYYARTMFYASYCVSATSQKLIINCYKHERLGNQSFLM